VRLNYQFKATKGKTTMRELTENECAFVSGGERLGVDGRTGLPMPPVNPIDPNPNAYDWTGYRSDGAYDNGCEMLDYHSDVYTTAGEVGMAIGSSMSVASKGPLVPDPSDVVAAGFASEGGRMWLLGQGIAGAWFLAGCGR
jgi:hypothetical protein